MDAYLNAPPIPENLMDRRRWWNQICINAMTNHTTTGCYRMPNRVSICDYLRLYGLVGRLQCNKCNQSNDMDHHPEHAFIGYKGRE